MSDEADVPTNLYRHFDSDGKLLYVGVSLNAVARLAQHRTQSHWFDRIANIAVQIFPNRRAALEAETSAILTESPMHNLAQRIPEPKLERSELSRQLSIQRVVTMRPLYSISQCADELNFANRLVHQLITDGVLGCVLIPMPSGNFKRMITGWQIIDYLENLERESKKEAGA